MAELPPVFFGSKHVCVGLFLLTSAGILQKTTTTGQTCGLPSASCS